MEHQQVNTQYAVISQLAETHGIQTFYSMDALNAAISEQLADLTRMKFESGNCFEMKQFVCSISANDFLTFLEKNPTLYQQSCTKAKLGVAGVDVSVASVAACETLDCSMLSSYAAVKEFNLDLEKVCVDGTYNFHFYLLWLDEKNVMEGIMLMTQ